MDCSIKKTTREEREFSVKKALAISISGADIPSNKTMKIVREYIDGKENLEDIKERVIKEYNENDR